MPRMLQLVLPGLFDLPLEELEPGFVNTALPCLNRILRLGSESENRDYSIDAILRSTLQLENTDTGLPLAQAFSEKTQQAGRSMLVEAIHLQAGMHNAIAVPVLHSDENLEDISNIINDLKDIFKVDFDISVLSDGLYLMRIEAFDPPTHYPHPLSVLGKSINPFVEQSRQVLPWYRLLNEIQMFMHQHPVNEQRLRRGSPAINSLWAWGGGRPETLDTGDVTTPAWYCEDLVLNRFAAGLGLRVNPVSKLVETIEREQAAVVVDLRLLQYLKTGLQEQLDRLLIDIEASLFTPLVQLSLQHSLPLRLRAGYRVDFELQPRDRFRFWRSSRSLADWRN